MDIKVWAERFLNYRMAAGLIKNFSKKDYGFEVNYTDYSKRVYTNNMLSNLKVDKVEKGSVIITLNNKSNFTFLINNWHLFSSREIILYFVNTEANEKWSVNAKVHSFVTDSSNLKKSLKSLFKTIPEER